MITLYDYWRSSAAYRVRIALNVKKLAYDGVSIDLFKGAQRSADYAAKNPQGFVPYLVTLDGNLGQSLAIIEYLDERYPDPPLLPSAPYARAQVRGLAQMVACDIHPLNNLRVLNYLKNPMQQPDDAIAIWVRHWIEQGFAALETIAQGHAFLWGDSVSLADICLVPQMANARRFDTDLAAFPKLVAIDAALRALPAFHAAAPENHPDAPI